MEPETVESAPARYSGLTIAHILFNHTIQTNYPKAMGVLRQAKDANADVINIAFTRVADFYFLWEDICRMMIGEDICLWEGCQQNQLITFCRRAAGKLGRAVGHAFLGSEACPGVGKDLCVLTELCGAYTIKCFVWNIPNFSTTYLLDCTYTAEPRVTDPEIQDMAVMVAVPQSHTTTAIQHNQSDLSSVVSQHSERSGRPWKVGDLEVQANTPLYDMFVRNTEKLGELWSCNGDHWELRLIEELRELWSYDCLKNCNGDDGKMRPLSMKMEDLLEVALARRKEALKHLHDRGKVGNCCTMHVIAEDDMCELFDRWQANVAEWMNTETLTQYQNLPTDGKHSNNKKAQAFLKKAFDTYLEQSFCSKFLLHKLIQLPLVQELSAAAMHQFAKSLSGSDLCNHYERI